MKTTHPLLVVTFFAASLLHAAETNFTPAKVPAPPVQPLMPEQALMTFQLPPGYRPEPVLTEPIIKEPVMAAFDGNGRIFVAEMRSYMQDIDGTGGQEPTSRVSLHWSSKGDGVFDQHTVFANELLLPRILLPLAQGRQSPASNWIATNRQAITRAASDRNLERRADVEQTARHGRREHPVTTVAFPPARAQFIRVTQTGSAKGLFWSIHEVQIFAPADPAQVAANRSLR